MVTTKKGQRLQKALLFLWAELFLKKKSSPKGSPYYAAKGSICSAGRGTGRGAKRTPRRRKTAFLTL